MKKVIMVGALMFIGASNVEASRFYYPCLHTNPVSCTADDYRQINKDKIESNTPAYYVEPQRQWKQALSDSSLMELAEDYAKKHEHDNELEELRKGEDISSHIIKQEHIKIKASELFENLVEGIETYFDEMLTYSVDNFQTVQLYGILLFIYLLPTVVAIWRRHPHRLVVAMANIVLGWFVIVWALTLLHASKRHEPYIRP